MTREAAIARAEAYFDGGGFEADLARRVAVASTSQEETARPQLRRYLADEVAPVLAGLGFACEVVGNPEADGPPFLCAERIEPGASLTLLSYAHGDVVRGLEEGWRRGLSPWSLERRGERLYGRGTADNKGQHSVNLGALAAVVAERGRLGFSMKILFETGEEVGSPGLRSLCAGELRDRLSADLFVASDGPRLAPDRPTIFLGSRGGEPVELVVDLREGAHHSGNWGGALANPATILSAAIATIVDRRGVILVPGLRPALPDSVRRALCRTRGLRRRGRPGGRRGLGRARPDPGRAGLRVEQLRGPGPPCRDAREPGQRDPRQRPRPLPAPLRRRHRRRRHRSRHPAPSRPRGIPRGRGPRAGRRQVRGNPARSRPSVGGLGERVDREDDRKTTRRSPQSRRLSSQRRVRRHSRTADDLGAPFLSRLFAARAGRAPARAGRPGRAGDHGGPVLGPRRARRGRGIGFSRVTRRARIPRSSRRGGYPRWWSGAGGGARFPGSRCARG